MENSILTAIVASSSTLFGVALASFSQLRTQRSNNQFQLALDASKRESEIKEKKMNRSLERLEKAHRLLSVIGREFSTTSLDIIWRAEMKDSEYDQRYLSVCQNVDELRVIVDLYETTLSGDVEEIYGEMNVFWGNFKEILRLTRLCEDTEASSHMRLCLGKAQEAANNIGSNARTLKIRLSDLANRYQTA